MRAQDPKRRVYCMPIPTRFAVGRVNCYLIEDDPLTLLDTGPNSATSLVALEAALAEHGRRIEDLERVVITHQHMDHMGLVDILATRSGAEVCALDRLAPWLADYKREMEAIESFSAKVMLGNGVPKDVVLALRATSAGLRAWGAAAHVTRTLKDGELLDFAGRSWRTLHRPGHSPSDTVFYDERSAELFVGDHLIKHISSKPLLSPPLPIAPADGKAENDGADGQSATGKIAAGAHGERPRALPVYLDSLRSTREMDARVAWAGHGDPIDDHLAVIDERLRMHERRANKLYRLIAEQPRNAYELARAMWGDVAVTQAYITLSEVLGHVDLLLDEGRVSERESDGVVYFEACC